MATFKIPLIKLFFWHGIFIQIKLTLEHIFIPNTKGHEHLNSHLKNMIKHSSRLQIDYWVKALFTPTLSLEITTPKCGSCTRHLHN